MRKTLAALVAALLVAIFVGASMATSASANSCDELASAIRYHAHEGNGAYVDQLKQWSKDAGCHPGTVV